ncbi:MAG TPA: VWA domain-containing protein [Gemmataceae bacterium]|nr:VWA domain-containing protein [Gemmataceae bacterium]
MRILGLVGIVFLLAISPVACSKKKDGKSSERGKDRPAVESARGTDKSFGAMEKFKGDDKKATEARITDREPFKEKASADPKSAPAVAEAMVATARKARLPKDSPQSGILTAGSFDDNLEPRFFHAFLNRFQQNQNMGDSLTKLQGRRLLLIVKDEAGKPVGNARVKLTAGGVGTELITRSDGRAVFVLPFDGLQGSGNLSVTATPPTGGETIQQTIPSGISRWEVTLPSVRATLPRYLDLAIVLDTTGSMGDELKYLQSEIRGITAAIQKRFPEVEQRFALVLYRDDGDEYVTRPFDFTPSIDTFHKNLSKQSASGGGDYPEAMHRGLEEATQLRWREQDSARVLFLIADAPPHAQHMTRTMNAANALRKHGVAIYPVACSGYDDACEVVMRSCAMLTGGQFLFLTDDSGVGNAHGEPHIPFYQVQRLEQLMIRMIASELSGRRIEPQASEIIRTVGKKLN